VVGDEAFDLPVGELHSILQPLGDPHRLRRREPEFAARFLRQGGRGEWRRRTFERRALVDRRDRPG